MTTTNLSVLKINYLTQAQYDTAAIAGTINADELYFISDADAGTVSAADVDIIDSGELYTGTNVETALQEIAGSGRTTENVKTNANNIETIKGVGWTNETIKGNATAITNHTTATMPHFATDPSDSKVYNVGIAVQSGVVGLLIEEVV